MFVTLMYCLVECLSINIFAIFVLIFGRTDFYRLMKSKDDKLGFPPGVAAKILLSVSSFFSKSVCIEFD